MGYADAFSFPFRDRLRGVVPSPTLNLVARGLCERIEDAVGPSGTVLVVACGEGGEGFDGFSAQFRFDNLLGVDIRRTALTDVRGDITALPIQTGAVDAVICQATLEHIADVSAAIDELVRVTTDGGLLYIDVPFLQGYHALPTDYRRYTARGLGRKMNAHPAVQTIESGPSKGPTSTLVWILCEYLAYLFSGGNYRLKKVLNGGFRVLLFWLKYLDRLLLKTHGDGDALSIPSAVYWLGRKQRAD